MCQLAKRWYAWLLVPALVGLPTTGLIYCSRNRISQQKFDHIVVGMSESEVTAILGEPARKEIDSGSVVRIMAWRNWFGQGAVTFDEQGKANWKGFRPLTGSEKLRWLATTILPSAR